jgi:hypothetical protein
MYVYALIYLFLLTLVPAHSRYIWQEAPIYEISTEKFHEKVLDSYDIVKQTASTDAPTHTPSLSLNSDNPYKSSNLTRFALYNDNYGVDPIPVYDLEGKQIKQITDIFVECYDENDCFYELTAEDRDELSNYASFIENSGVGQVDVPYSLGIIRSKFSVNVLGMYTEGFAELNNRIGFWIRLQEGDGSRKYSHLPKYDKTVALLDLSVHERSHYDQPTYNNNAAHCDLFQSNYNYLFQRASRSLSSYVSLVHYSGADTHLEVLDIVLISLVGLLTVVSIGLILQLCRVRQSNDYTLVV